MSLYCFTETLYIRYAKGPGVNLQGCVVDEVCVYKDAVKGMHPQESLADEFHTWVDKQVLQLG